jgi:hypothetical protein
MKLKFDPKHCLFFTRAPLADMTAQSQSDHRRSRASRADRARARPLLRVASIFIFDYYQKIIFFRP